MSSIQRLHKFAELLCQAIPDLDLQSLSPRPLDDPSATRHVGRLLMRNGGPGAVRVLFCVSEASEFVPVAFTQVEDTEVGWSLELVQEFAVDKPTPPVGLAFDMNDLPALSGLGVSGFILLTPGMLAPLSTFDDGISNGGESFEPRLLVYLSASEVAEARADFPALMNRFAQDGRSVFLGRAKL